EREVFMGRMKTILLSLLSVLALPSTVFAEPSRDQAVLNAILRVETRYLDEDRRDPNLTTGTADQAATIRKAKYLDKLLALENLSKETVLAGYKDAQERIKKSSEAKKPVRDVDKARLEAF